MGHAHHFLSRLDRVSDAHVQLALELYRDEAIVAHVLERVRVPEGAERVAISLEDPTEGPFLVVTRDARFVTCLGPGMKPSGLPVITRAQLDTHTATLASFRERMKRAKTIEAQMGLVPLFKRIWTAGSDLSREEFDALAAFAPWLGNLYFQYAADMQVHVGKRFEDVRAIRHPIPPVRPLLRDFYCQLWGQASLLALATFYEGAFEIVPPAVMIGAWQQVLTFQVVGLSLRSLWSLSRSAKFTLGAFKEKFAAAHGFYATLQYGLAVIACGLGHARLAEEVRKFLSSHKRGGDPTTLPLRAALSEQYEDVLRDPGAAHARSVAAGRAYAVDYNEDAPRNGPVALDAPDTIPEPLAYSFLAAHEGNYVRQIHHVQILIDALPWILHAEPEHLFFPRAVHRQIRGPWSPTHTLELFYVWNKKRAQTPEVAKKTVGRNDACPCGSGKKYKRCCDGSPSVERVASEENDSSEGAERVETE